MKKLIIIFLLCISSVNAQTLSDSVKQLWTKVFGVNDTTAIMPVLKDSILTSNYASVISQMYQNPIVIGANKYKIYYLWTDQRGTFFISLISNYLRFWDYDNQSIKTTTTLGAESIFQFNGQLYGFLHSWNAALCYQEVRQNVNGTWISITPKMELGEDGYAMPHVDSVYWSIRTKGNVFPRDISLKKSKDLINWTSTKLILTPDQQDRSNGIEFYVMPIFQITGDNGIYGLLCIYDVPNDKTYIQLTYNADGYGENWKRCKNKRTFLPIPNGINQMYSLPVVYNDTLHCVTSMSKQKHNQSSKFGIYDFTIATRDLGGWKN